MDTAGDHHDLPPHAPGAPFPGVVCLLPQYEEQHMYWLIHEFLQAGGFQHTVSAFKLELAARGVLDAAYTQLSQVCWARMGCVERLSVLHGARSRSTTRTTTPSSLAPCAEGCGAEPPGVLADAPGRGTRDCGRRARLPAPARCVCAQVGGGGE
jgi:hypothetical protein